MMVLAVRRSVEAVIRCLIQLMTCGASRRDGGTKAMLGSSAAPSCGTFWKHLERLTNRLRREKSRSSYWSSAACGNEATPKALRSLTASVQVSLVNHEGKTVARIDEGMPGWWKLNR
jgi:hypothetical protein